MGPLRANDRPVVGGDTMTYCLALAEIFRGVVYDFGYSVGPVLFRLRLLNGWLHDLPCVLYGLVDSGAAGSLPQNHNI